MELIDKFLGVVNTGIESWYEAGQILVEIKQLVPDGFAQIMKRAPYITPDILHSFLAMGRRELYPPALLASNGPAGDRLLEMPYEHQQRACTEEIEVVRLVKGGHRITKKPLSQIAIDEAGTVFSRAGIRSVPEQIRLLSQTRNPLADNQSKPKWRHRPAGLSRDKAMLKSCGVFKIIRSDSGYEIKEVSREQYPFATPIEFLAGNESEPFELLQ